MDASHRTLPRWIAGVFLALFLAAAAALAAWAVELPYVAFSPGPVADAVDSIRAVGEVDLHPVEGELLMLTIAAQEVNAYEVLIAALDPSVDLVRLEAVRREGETDEEYQRRQLDVMHSSEQTAIAVALAELGLTPDSDGVVVGRVFEGYPAAGVVEEGDFIREVEGRPIGLTSDIADALEGKAPGDEVELVLERDGEPQRVTIVLGESAQDPGRPLIGVEVTNVNPRFPVEIESGNIGGPSAGLMYALAVIDLLSPDDLTRGKVVAGTGTIGLDGTVGPIGGIRQKVVAAEAAGADVMLVPQDNYDDALAAPRESLELVPVGHIDDALAYLDSLSI